MNDILESILELESESCVQARVMIGGSQMQTSTTSNHVALHLVACDIFFSLQAYLSRICIVIRRYSILINQVLFT